VAPHLLEMRNSEATICRGSPTGRRRWFQAPDSGSSNLPRGTKRKNATWQQIRMQIATQEPIPAKMARDFGFTGAAVQADGTGRRSMAVGRTVRGRQAEAPIEMLSRA
jgi:hypothetical protein